MRCEECQAKVEDYFDGELDEQTTDLVEQHMDACATCASAFRKVEREQELFLRYECNAQASPTFWDNVMARAAQETSARSSQPLSRVRRWLGNRLGNFSAPRFSPSLTALIVLVAIGITAVVMRYFNSSERATTPVSISQNGVVPVPLPTTTPDQTINPVNETKANGTGVGIKAEAKEPPQLTQNGVGRRGSLLAASRGNAGRISVKAGAAGRKRTPDELVREAEQKYVAAITMLSRDVSRRRSRLDAKTAAQFERTLAAIDRTIMDTRRAVRQHPGDPVAAQYMLTAYSKKVDALREMIGY